jgi:hypothetical protein
MPKRPRDPNQLAKLIVDIATGETEDTISESKRLPSPKRAGGLKGGPSRANKLSRQKRPRRDGRHSFSALQFRADSQDFEDYPGNGRWPSRSCLDPRRNCGFA